MQIIKTHLTINGRGEYDLPAETKVVETDKGWFVVNDEYCGEGKMEGGCLRPHLYALPESEARSLLAQWDSQEDRWKFADYGLGLIEWLVKQPGVEMLGRIWNDHRGDVLRAA